MKNNSLLEQSFIVMDVLDENMEPKHSTTGCIVKHRNKYYILTVEHAVHNYLFHLRVRWDSKLKQLLLRKLGDFDRIKSIDNKEIKTKDILTKCNILDSKEFIDFAFKDVSSIIDKLDSYFQILKEDGSGDIILEKPKLVFEIDMTSEPKANELCGFAGLVMPQYEKHPFQPIYMQRLQKTVIKYIGKWEENPDYYKFKSTIPIKNHDYYRGCSGSPILNSKGEPIALVNFGNIIDNEIYGISICACKKYIDIVNSYT